jgi:hypothetical protein
MKRAISQQQNNSSFNKVFNKLLNKLLKQLLKKIKKTLDTLTSVGTFFLWFAVNYTVRIEPMLIIVSI